jgi:hypothetical protein
MIGSHVLLCGSRGPAPAGTVSVRKRNDDQLVASTDRRSPIKLYFDLNNVWRSPRSITKYTNSRTRLEIGQCFSRPILSRDPQDQVPRERWDGGPNDLRWTQWMLQYAVFATIERSDRGPLLFGEDDATIALII